MTNQNEIISSGKHGPRARNTHELTFFISLQTCPACNARYDESLFWLSAETDTAASMTGKCRECLKPMGFSFLGGNLLQAPMGNLDEVGPGRTEILMPWRLAAEIDLLSPRVFDDPTQLDLEPWKINRDINKRVIKCAHELLKLLDEGKPTIDESLLSAEDQHYRELNPKCFSRAWIEPILKRHRNISAANIKDMPRINQLESATPKRRRRKK